jgi:hypothetical protein
MQSHLADIDELLLRCRDEEARQYIAEAVASYKTGAFRACIVVTWIAVLYDFLYKLRELELAGDGQAKAKLEEFEKASKGKDYNKSLEFERNVLKFAHEDFEFINDIEYHELQRLYEDRNRCAHPSMTSTDEVYSPSSELARYHLRNAVNYMLQYPPTQGKTFVDSLLTDTKSPFFPTDVDEAVKYFKSKLVDRTKASVLKSIATAMVKGLILEDFDEAQFKRTATALLALRELQRNIVESAIETHLSTAITRTNDENLVRVFQFLENITDTYEYLRDDVRIRLENYLNSVKDEDKRACALNVALDVPTLRNVVVELLEADKVSVYVLSALFNYKIRPEFTPIVLRHYRKADSFALANDIGKNMVALFIEAGSLSPYDVREVISICSENGQVYHSYEFKTVLQAIHRSNILTEPELDALLQEYEDVNRKYRKVIFPDTEEDEPS